jgi:DNA-binding NarL/FixJ family response regulator
MYLRPLHAKQRPLRILMIDDHPSQLEGYKAILRTHAVFLKAETQVCFTCEKAYDLIVRQRESFDIIFLDQNMPGFPAGKISAGEDLARLITQYLPQSRIIMITSFVQSFTLYHLFKKIDPAGLLVKSDFTAEGLLEAFNCILNGQKFYSETVKRSVHKLLSKDKYLDSCNRQLITLLSKGIRTKSLPEYLHLSLSAVEKRKAQVKDYLCLERRGSDEDIVREARRQGFI